MWLICEILNKKENKLMKDIGFSTDDYRVKVLNMDEEVFFDSDELINKIKQEKQINKQEEENDTNTDL
jgi:hypothetical protein